MRHSMEHETSNVRAANRHHSHRSHTRSMSPRSDSHRHDRVRDHSRSRRHHRSSHSPGHISKHGTRHGEWRHHRHERTEPSPVSTTSPILPYNARQLSKRDLAQLEPLFAMYLDIQKGIIIEDLSEEEIKGRWKSFIKKWNRGELAEGWYDPATFAKAKDSLNNERLSPERNINRDSASLNPPEPPGNEDSTVSNDKGDAPILEDEDDEDYGPKLPHGALTTRGHPSGPTIPKLQDLELQREQARADWENARSAAHAQHKGNILSHKSHLRAFEDEIAPRAEPGTHERKIEKRREAAAANREFASGRRGGSPAMDAAPEAELMGGGGSDDLEALKRAKEQEMRKKNERERRREEILRAKKAEREERLAEYRQKEEETMGWLKALAKQRFG